MAVIYIPRVLGGTIVLVTGPTPPPPSGVTLVQAKSRDGKVTARGR